MRSIGGPAELYKNRVGINLQAQPIFVYKSEFKIKDDFLKSFLDSQSFHKDGGKIKVNLSNSQSILTDYEELGFIKDRFFSIATNYAKDVLQIDNQLSMPHSWIAITKKGDDHHEHIHQNAFFSIVYYARIKSGNLHLQLEKSTIEKIFNFHYQIRNYNIYNSSAWEIVPQEGDFIVFPADIRHSTSPNESDEDRIIFGANFFLTGETGDQVQLTKLDLGKTPIEWP